MISNFFLQLLICIEKLNLQTECYTTQSLDKNETECVNYYYSRLKDIQSLIKDSEYILQEKNAKYRASASKISSIKDLV